MFFRVTLWQRTSDYIESVRSAAYTRGFNDGKAAGITTCRVTPYGTNILVMSPSISTALERTSDHIESVRSDAYNRGFDDGKSAGITAGICENLARSMFGSFGSMFMEHTEREAAIRATRRS